MFETVSEKDNQGRWHIASDERRFVVKVSNHPLNPLPQFFRVYSDRIAILDHVSRPLLRNETLTVCSIAAGAHGTLSAAPRCWNGLAFGLFGDCASKRDNLDSLTFRQGRDFTHNYIGLMWRGRRGRLFDMRRRALAARLGAVSVDLDRLEGALAEIDILVACAAGDAPLLTGDLLNRSMGARGGRPMFIIDIGVPRNVDAAADGIPDLYIYNIDDLQAVVARNLASRMEKVEAGSRLVADEARDWLRRLSEFRA